MLPVLLGDHGVDAVLVLFVPPVTATADEVALAVARASKGAEKPVLAAVMDARGIPAGLTDAGVAAFTYPEWAARALGRAAARGEWLRRPVGAFPSLDRIDRAAARALVGDALSREPDRWLEPGETPRCLWPTASLSSRRGLLRRRTRPARAAAELGFPAVVKTAVAGAHKTETGGVALDLPDEDAVREAAGRIGGPIIVQPMKTGSAELLAGLVQDPLFGPLVALGPGGVMAELIGDAGIRIAPLTDVDARELVLDGKTGALIRGYRGKPPADADSVIDLLHRLSALGEDLPEVAELDLNPVLVAPDGCVAVDARVRVTVPEVRQHTKTW